MKSAFCWALLIFTALNGLLNSADRSKGIAPETVNEQLFDYSGTEASPQYLRHTANVLLLGSSLFLHPEWSVDRNLEITEPWGKATIVSESHYHLAQGLENELVNSGFEQPYVYNLAAGGALISDAYLLLFHYLQKHPKPAVVVLDCAPRSFSDTGVNQPEATPVFDRCFQIQDFPLLHEIYLGSTNAKINFFLSQMFFVYHHRKWLAEDATKQLVGSLGCLLRSKKECVVPKTAIPTNSAASNKKETVTIEQAEQASRMAKSLQEYRDRYRWMTRQGLAPQLRFLQRVQDLCAEKKIKLIIVNMPLSQQNKNLLSDGFYDGYRSDVANAVHGDAVFLDLARSEGNWPINYYHDSVHLNERGGVQLNKVIANAITRRVMKADSGSGVSQ
ncbi:MAG TPA: hypothetical protein V6C97_08945 [Oculatellaceae cyanobacterium]